MKYILALMAMLMAGSAFGTVTVPRIELKAEDFDRLGIVLTAVDSSISRSTELLPVVVTLNLESFTACSVSNVYLGFVDEFENLMAGTSVAPGHGGYVFQVNHKLFEASRLTLSCAYGGYVINVGREVPVLIAYDR